MGNQTFGGTTAAPCPVDKTRKSEDNLATCPVLRRRGGNESDIDMAKFNKDNLLMLVNDRGEIVSINKTFEARLLYKRGSLRGNHIGILMTPFSEMLHRLLFLENYKEASALERDVIATRLNAKTYGKRPLIIFDAFRRPVLVNLHIEPINKPALLRNVLDVLFSDDGDVEDEETAFRSAPYYFVAELTEVEDNANFIFSDSVELKERLDRMAHLNCDFERSPGVIIMNIDLVGSTQILSDHGVPSIIHVCKTFFADIVKILRSEYHPYLCIHEVAGDGFILLLNASWTYNLPMISAMLAVNFAVKLLNATASYVKARIGISMGDVFFGFIGDKLRIFGEAMNESARLQGAAQNGTIMFNDVFRQKLTAEMGLFAAPEAESAFSQSSTEQTLELKGFGARKCHSIVPPPVSLAAPSVVSASLGVCASPTPRGTAPSAADFIAFKRGWEASPTLQRGLL